MFNIHFTRSLKTKMTHLLAMKLAISVFYQKTLLPTPHTGRTQRQVSRRAACLLGASIALAVYYLSSFFFFLFSFFLSSCKTSCGHYKKNFFGHPAQTLVPGSKIETRKLKCAQGGGFTNFAKFCSPTLYSSFFFLLSSF